MQDPVRELVKLGPWPDEHKLDVETLKKFQALLEEVETPISDEEACALLGVFGRGDAFGLAWSLVHVIETAPGWPIWNVLTDNGNEWVAHLARRSRHLKDAGYDTGT